MEKIRNVLVAAILVAGLALYMGGFLMHLGSAVSSGTEAMTEARLTVPR